MGSSIRERVRAYLEPAVAALHRSEFETAIRLLKAAIGEAEKHAPEESDLSACLSCLGLAYQHKGCYAEAESNLMRALLIDEEIRGRDSYAVGTSVANLALIYRDQGKSEEARRFFERALRIFRETLGPSHPETRKCEKQYADLLTGILTSSPPREEPPAGAGTKDDGQTTNRTQQGKKGIARNALLCATISIVTAAVVARAAGLVALPMICAALAGMAAGTIAAASGTQATVAAAATMIGAVSSVLAGVFDLPVLTKIYEAMGSIHIALIMTMLTPGVLVGVVFAVCHRHNLSCSHSYRK